MRPAGDFVPERRQSDVLVGGRHDPVRLALAFIIFLLAAVTTTDTSHTVASAYLESTPWAPMSPMQIRVMLDCESRCDDLVGSGG